MIKKTTILLAMPWHNNIYKIMESALAYHGFQVVSTVLDDGIFRYPSFSTRLQTKFRQIVLQDKDAKRRLKEKLFDDKIKAAIENGVDFLFFHQMIYTIQIVVFCQPPIFISITI